VFIVGHLGNAGGLAGAASQRDAGGMGRVYTEALFERESAAWNPPPSREKGEGATRDAAASPGIYQWASGGGDDLKDRAQALRAGAEHSYQIVAIPDPAQVVAYRTDSTGANGCGVLEDGTTHTLGGATDVVAFGLQTANSNMRGPIYKKEQAWTVQPHPSQTRTAVAWHNHQQDGSIRIQDDGTCPTVSKHWGTGGNNVPMVGVRRLTPTECERLQGFPDGWTDVDGASDSARYRQLGNAVAVPCAEWLARRIVAVEEAT